MKIEDNKLINELLTLQESLSSTTNMLIKDIKRQDKIMTRSDKRQRQEYDELQQKLEEVKLLEKAQKDLLDSFIELIAGAIDAKSKYTGGHCNRVPQLAVKLTQIASDSEAEAFKNFSIKSDDEMREVSIASWLHDCGKVTTPEYVVDKATKLETIYNRIHEIRTRFEVMHRDKTIEALTKKLAGEDTQEVDAWLEKEQEKLQEDFTVLANANVGAEFMKDEDLQRIEEIAQQTWVRNFDDTLGLAHEEKQRILQENSTTPQVEKILDDKHRHIIPREDFDYEEYSPFQS